MPLKTISISDLTPYLQQEEIDGIMSADALGGMIISTCNQVAGYVNSNPSNRRIELNSSKVPEELVGTTCIIIKHRIISSVPASADALEGSSRSNEYRDAMDLLRRVSEGTYKLTPWDTTENLEDGIHGSINGVLWGDSEPIIV